MGLKKKSVSGFIWTSAGTLGNGIISFIVTIVLARVLLPYHFALIELLIIFVAVSNVIVDSGFSQAIIRDDNPSKRDLSSVFYFNMVLSVLLYILLYSAAPYISDYFEAPELKNLARVVFLIIIFNSLSLIQYATLSRELNFEAVNKSSIISSVLTGAIAIILALSGVGVWAIVANMTLMPLFRTALYWYFSKWRPIWSFSFASIRKYFSFGVFLMLQGLLDTIVTNIASFIIGKSYTKNDLGYYSQGGKFNSYAITPLSSVLTKVTYPILSKIKNEPLRLKDAYSKVISIIVYFTLPFSLFLYFNSENTILFFFGEKWQEAAVYLSLFAIFGFFSTIQKVCMNIIMITGNTKTLFYFSFIKQTVRLVTILAVIKISVYAIAAANIYTSVIASLFYIGLGMYYINYTVKELIVDNYKTFISGVITTMVIIIINILNQSLSTISLFLVQGIFLLITYFGSSYLLKNKNFNEFFNIIKGYLVKFK